MEINGESKLYAILGNPIAHSLSPVMHNAAFRFLGKNSIYMACCVTEGRLPEAVAGLKALGFCGANVTIPFKSEVIPLLDGITKEARLIGAVNTLYWYNNRLWGANTDGPGFTKALTDMHPKALDGGSVVILGAGGSARAVGVSLVLSGVKEIYIVNRSRDKADLLGKLLRELGSQVVELAWEEPVLGDVIAQSNVVVNTTSLGMTPWEKKAPAIDYARLSPKHVVVDLVYKPRETLFLQQARKQGCNTMNGLRMLLEQGALSFEMWTGEKAPVQVMARELERRL